MNLNMTFVQSLASTQQLAIGRMWEKYRLLSAKPVKTPGEMQELEKATVFLKPYSDEPAGLTEPVPSRRAQRDEKVAAGNRGIVLNSQKVKAANLSGARELGLHRDSAALGRLLSKPEASLSVGERHELKSLKARLSIYVGMTGYTATDADFKVAA
jgi:hypothetical protein